MRNLDLLENMSSEDIDEVENNIRCGSIPNENDQVIYLGRKIIDETRFKFAIFDKKALKKLPQHVKEYCLQMEETEEIEKKESRAKEIAEKSKKRLVQNFFEFSK